MWLHQTRRCTKSLKSLHCLVQHLVLFLTNSGKCLGVLCYPQHLAATFRQRCRSHPVDQESWGWVTFRDQSWCLEFLVLRYCWLAIQRSSNSKNPSPHSASHFITELQSIQVSLSSTPFHSVWSVHCAVCPRHLHATYNEVRPVRSSTLFLVL